METLLIDCNLYYRELLHKPVVLCKDLLNSLKGMNFENILFFYKFILFSLWAACGHISCFWCIHKSMDSIHESHCPICTHPYNHFPTICQMLHFLLLKEYPVAYKRRENQILGKVFIFHL